MLTSSIGGPELTAAPAVLEEPEADLRVVRSDARRCFRVMLSLELPLGSFALIRDHRLGELGR